MTSPAVLDPVEAPSTPAPPKRQKATKAIEGLRILRLVALGKLRKHACARVGVNLRTFEKWVEHDPDFLALYQVARVQQAHSLAEEMVELADEPVGSDMAEVQRNRLRVDTRKWYVSKLAPKLYGDRIEHEHKHTVGVVMLPPIAGPVAVTQSGQASASTGPSGRLHTGMRALLARSVLQNATDEVLQNDTPAMTLDEVRARTMTARDSESHGVGTVSADGASG